MPDAPAPPSGSHAERDDAATEAPATPATPANPAAPAAARTTAEDGRSRLWRAFSRPQRSQVVVAVLLALVGFAAVTQVRANQVDDTYAGLREQDLIDILNGLASSTQRAQSEIQRLENARDDLQSDTRARQTALEEARKQAQVLSILAGTVPVRGPGITITIEEQSGEARVGPFLDMIQAMRSADAEAMQINGEVRVVAQTSFEESADGLLVDGRLVEAPYTVDVIGPPDNLVSALRFPEGPQDQFEEAGAELTFDEQASVEIDAVREPVEADVAQAQQ